MKLIDQLKRRVESYRDYIVNEDPFNRAILDGRAEAEAIERFLINVHYLVKHTPVHLKLAAQVSQDDPRLNAYFKEKFLEEQGHDQWALDDLAKLSSKLKEPQRPPEVAPAMFDFVLNIESIIRKDPYLYLPYIFFAEYLVVIYGPQMTQALAVKNGYGSESLTVIENHAELDQDHVHEWEEIIASIVDEQRYTKAFLEVMDETIRLHKLFFIACAGKVRHEAA